MNRQYLLMEDDRAPDAREYFDKALFEKFNLTIQMFKEHGIEVVSDDELTISYYLSGYVLVYHGDDPYYKLRKASSRTERWLHFSDQVDRHIIHYANKQYDSPEGNGQVDSFSIKDCFTQIERYISRNKSGVNARGPKESLRDMLKIAHYAQFIYDKMQHQMAEGDVYVDESQGED